MDIVEAKARGFEAGQRHPWELARLALVERLIARHVTLPPGSVVVDVGCGDTFVVDALARRYAAARFYAVDSAFTPSLIASYQAQSAPNVRLFASLDDVAIDRPAALVLLMDVLEHVDDDVALLRGVDARLAGADTRVLVTVPAYPSLFSSHDRLLGHYRRYSPRTLSALLRNASLSSIETGQLFASLLAIRVLQVIGERVRRGRDRSNAHLGTWSHRRRLTMSLAAALTMDGRVGMGLGRRGLALPGLSLYALCRTSA